MFDVGKRRPDTGRFWPYLIFLLFAAGYFSLFLADGFNATDEGYLQSLGQRVVDGEVPYVDFHFLRTPLSIYLQAGLIAMLGDSYTILAARVFWALQMVLLTLLVSTLYRKMVTRSELVLLLIASLVVSSLLIMHPWYSYDAAFFAIIAAVLWVKRQYFLAGMAMFLAAMCKQTYLALLPGFLVLATIVQWRCRELKLVKPRAVVALVIGFAVPAAVCLGLLAAVDGGLAAFWRDVFILPTRTSDLSPVFFFFQDNARALVIALPAVAAILAAWRLDLSHRGALALVLALALGAAVNSLWGYQRFVYTCVYINYAFLALVVWRTVRDGGGDSDRRRELPALALMGGVIQYLSGYNYTGIVFGYIGLLPGMIAGWLWLRFECPAPWGPRAAIALIVAVTVLGGFHRYNYVARDMDRASLDAEFTVDGLRGIRSTKRNVTQIEGLLQVIEEKTEPGDYILAFPDFPCLYYLSDRKNPTKIDWYTLREFTVPMLEESLEGLPEKQPELVLLQKYPEGDFKRRQKPIDYLRIKRYQPAFRWVTKQFRHSGFVGDVGIWVPSSDRR